MTSFGSRCVACCNGPSREVPARRSQIREVQFHRTLRIELSHPARLAVGQSLHSHRLVLIHLARMYEISVMTNKIEERGGSARGAVARQRSRLSAMPAKTRNRYMIVRLILSNIHNSDIMLVLLLRIHKMRKIFYCATYINSNICDGRDTADAPSA